MLAVLGTHQFLAFLILHDEAGDGTGGDGEWARQIHESRPAAAREIAVLSTDHDLIGASADSGSGINAGTATGLNHMRSGPLEDVEIAFTHAVVAGFLRAELDIELA